MRVELDSGARLASPIRQRDVGADEMLDQFGVDACVDARVEAGGEPRGPEEFGPGRGVDHDVRQRSGDVAHLLGCDRRVEDHPQCVEAP